MRRHALLVIALSVLSLPAFANAEVATYALDPAHSEIGFTVRHFVSKVPGRFGTFERTLEVEPKSRGSRPQGARRHRISASQPLSQCVWHVTVGSFFLAQPILDRRSRRSGLAPVLSHPQIEARSRDPRSREDP